MGTPACGRGRLAAQPALSATCAHKALVGGHEEMLAAEIARSGSMSGTQRLSRTAAMGRRCHVSSGRSPRSKGIDPRVDVSIHEAQLSPNAHWNRETFGRGPMAICPVPDGHRREAKPIGDFFDRQQLHVNFLHKQLPWAGRSHVHAHIVALGRWRQSTHQDATTRRSRVSVTIVTEHRMAVIKIAHFSDAHGAPRARVKVRRRTRAAQPSRMLPSSRCGGS